MRKRLRLLWALLTQDWRAQTCKVCRETWISTVNAPEVGADLCADCEGKAFNEWITAHHKGAA